MNLVTLLSTTSNLQSQLWSRREKFTMLVLNYVGCSRSEPRSRKVKTDYELIATQSDSDNFLYPQLHDEESDSFETLLRIRIARYFEAKCYNECIRLIDEIPATEQRSSVFKNVKANCLFNLENFREAKKVLFEVLAENPEDYEAGFIFSKCLYHEGDLSVSINSCSAILSVRPEFQHVKDQQQKAKKLFKLLCDGRQCYLKKRYEEATKLFTQALAVDPDNKKVSAVIFNNRAMCLKLRRYYKSAIEDFNEVSKLNPHDKTVHQKRAECYYKLMKLVECQRDCEEALMVQESESIKKLLKKCLKKMTKGVKFQ